MRGSCGATAIRNSPRLYEYLLTEKGRDLAPALLALSEWGDRWAAPDGPPILYAHTACGSALSHEVISAMCGPLEKAEAVHAGPGPGMPADRAELFTPPPSSPPTHDTQ